MYFVFNIQLCLLFVFLVQFFIIKTVALTLATYCLNGRLLDLYIIIYCVNYTDMCICGQKFIKMSSCLSVCLTAHVKT